MIAKLTGTVSDILGSFIILDINGVGYKVILSSLLLNQVKPKDKQSYYIYTHVREEVFDLYGFKSKEELFFFQLLISVSNIGPKTALSVFNLGSVDHIIQAIEKGDSEYFLQVPRIGRKNAQRIIVELRNKIGSLTDIDLTFSESKANKEIIEALQRFGFKTSEIRKVLSNLSKDLVFEEKIKQALKNLGKKI